MIGWARERERENCWHLNLTIWYGNLTTWKLNTHYTRMDRFVCLSVYARFRPRNPIVQRPIGRVRTTYLYVFHTRAMMYSLHFRLYQKNYTHQPKRVHHSIHVWTFHDSVICNVEKRYRFTTQSTFSFNTKTEIDNKILWYALSIICCNLSNLWA